MCLVLVLVELPDGNYALKTLPSITSQTDDFFAMLSYGVFGLLLFLVLLPGLLFMQLKKSVDAGMLYSEDTQKRFGTTYMKYRVSCWWFEFAVMGRKIMLAAIAIMSGSAIVAVVLSAATVAISIAVHMKFKPFLSTPHAITLVEDGTMVHNGDSEDFFSPSSDDSRSSNSLTPFASM